MAQKVERTASRLFLLISLTSQHFWLFRGPTFGFVPGPLLKWHCLCSLLTRINIAWCERIRTLRIYPTQKSTKHMGSAMVFYFKTHRTTCQKEHACVLFWNYLMCWRILDTQHQHTREPFHAVRPPRFYWCSCRSRRERVAAYVGVEKPPWEGFFLTTWTPS
jgi:hypothetical protein